MGAAMSTTSSVDRPAQGSEDAQRLPPWDLVTERFDVGDALRLAPPTRSYIVASTPRSGSSLLCDGLALTGVLGVPVEYFNPVHREALAARWGCGSHLSGYLGGLCRMRTTPEGVFAAELHWEHALRLREELGRTGAATGAAAGARPTGLDLDAEIFERVLPGLRYIRIIRQDVDKQAVSFCIAAQTGRWGDIPGQDLGGGVAEPIYRFEDVDRCRRWIEATELAWDRFFRRNAIAPLEVVYEDFVTDYVATFERIAAFLEVPIATVATPRMRPQRTGMNDEFLERYMQDRILRGFDQPPVPDPA